jgi:hypothetical protein
MMQEWKGATNRYRIQSVSATPINLRPTPSGVEVHVRYTTRANERYAARTCIRRWSNCCIKGLRT